jgi:hypothetical protein
MGRVHDTGGTACPSQFPASIRIFLNTLSRSLRRRPLLLLIFVPFAALAGCAERHPRIVDTPPGSVEDLADLRGVVLLEDFSDRQIFPTDNWWNLDIAQAPVDSRSVELIEWIGGTRGLHPDFGPPPYGIPYVGVAGDQPLLEITFVSYPDESDPGAPGRPPGYPVPAEARTLPNYIEGGIPGGGNSGDRHMILIDRDHWLLFETFATRWNNTLQRWEAGSGATWNLAANDRRPDGWTSADAAGLAIFPGLIRYEDAYGTAPVRHAFRFTTRATNGYVWPASHEAGDDPDAPPMGARLRLRADKDISGYPAPIRRLLQAMKTYGLILADNGSDMYIQGTMDPRWDNDLLNPAFDSIEAADFEVIQLGWNPEPAGVRDP